MLTLDLPSSAQMLASDRLLARQVSQVPSTALLQPFVAYVLQTAGFGETHACTAHACVHMPVNQKHTSSFSVLKHNCN